MQPLFTEKEEKGIYTASLDVVTDNGVSVNQTFSLDLKLIKENEVERLLNLGLSLSAIDKQIETFIHNEKAFGLQELHKRFNENVSRNTVSL